MPLLKKGRVMVSDVTDTCYRVTSHRIAKGGFGEIYRGAELDKYRDARREIAIKVGVDPIAWHGEAYFGRLLAGEPHVVALHDAFPVVDGRGRARLVKYVLIFDWLEEGTIEDVLERSRVPWPEKTVVQQIVKILKVLSLLHKRGICHGDITPGNIFIRQRTLLLGDLGIAKQSLDDGPIRLDGATPAIFMPTDVSPFYWSPSEDVYQVGLIALSLLAGEVITSQQVCGRALRALEAEDATKGWIRSALKGRKDRFRDSEEALNYLRGDAIKPAPAPRNLRGQRVVFTGTLSIKREVAAARARRAGAQVQSKVNGQTSLIVAGEPNALMIGQRRGTKLFDAHRRIGRGQKIAIIGDRRFMNLIRRK